MNRKHLTSLAATLTLLAGALLLPAPAAAHDRDDGGHRRHAHGWHHERKHRPRHRVIHEHHYVPMVVERYRDPPVVYRDPPRRGYGIGNALTITFSHAWD